MRCKICGVEFPRKGKRGPIPRYCSRRCKEHGRRRYQERALFFTCVECGQLFPRGPVGPAQHFCSKLCRQIASGQASRKFTLPCPVCGTAFLQRRSWQRFCSTKCRQEYQKERRRGRPWLRGGDPRWRNGGPRIRAVHRALAAVGLSVEDLARLQKHRCPICGKRLLEELSIDHIVPVSCGGSHEPENIQITHLRCNLSRNRYGPGQPRLLEVKGGSRTNA